MDEPRGLSLSPLCLSGTGQATGGHRRSGLPSAQAQGTPQGLLTGEHFMLGDHAAAEGAILAGCRFFAGYPITPATEIAERMSVRLPQVGGVYIQMEDELASMNAI